MGEHVFDFFLRNKRAEWENYRSHVTPFELKTYLSLCRQAEPRRLGMRERLRYRHGCGQTRDAATQAARRRSARIGRTARARADLDRLGWNTDAHVELLWSLSRAPDADAALRTMVRLADALGDGLGRTRTRWLLDRRCAAGCSRVLGSSLALGDHLVAHPQSWHLLAGHGARCRRPDELRRDIHRAGRTQRTQRQCRAAAARRLYRDRLLVLAALDLAPTVENEPVLPFTTVGDHLSDLADAALAAALTVATSTVCGTTTPRRGWPSSRWASAVRAN